VVSDWLAVAAVATPRVRVHWNFKQGDRLWIWVVQSRFGNPGEMTNARVVLELTPKKEEPPAGMPWPPPGPANFRFDSHVPMKGAIGGAFTGIQVWSTDYSATINWAYPNFTLTAPSRSYEDLSPSLTVSGTVDAARKVVQVSIDAKRPNTQTRYNRLRVTLRDLPCSYRVVDDYYYNYTCEVSAAALRDNAGAYVTNFTDETWAYNYDTKSWKLENTSHSDYKVLNPIVGDWNAGVLAVQFVGRR
jgi:hypothetical protein